MMDGDFLESWTAWPPVPARPRKKLNVEKSQGRGGGERGEGPTTREELIRNKLTDYEYTVHEEYASTTRGVN